MNIRRRGKALQTICVQGTALVLSLTLVACSAEPRQEQPIRLLDLVSSEDVAKAETGSSGAGSAGAGYALEWRFDEPASSNGDGSWRAGFDVERVDVRDGSLRGRATSPLPVLYVRKPPRLHAPDLLHSIEVRLKADAGTNLRMSVLGPEIPSAEQVLAQARFRPWLYESPIIASGEFHTYTLRSPYPDYSTGIHHILLQPTDAAGAEFEIDSIRFVFRQEHLARLSSGVGWQGLAGVFRETLALRSGEKVALSTRLGSKPRFGLAVGTPEIHPVTFHLRLSPRARPAEEAITATRTITTPERWEELAIDLAPLAGQEVDVELSVSAEKPGALGFWGSPAIWNAARPEAEESEPARPQGVILIVTDTLRADHLELYGYHRETAPNLSRIAAEGVAFEDCVAQATWTKVSMASILTSLYARSHGVEQLNDRLPSASTTLAEAFREHGHATLALSSNVFFGSFTNLHQGFEVFHESPSLADPLSSKTSRELADRLHSWLESHRDVPFFAVFHVFDPHSPYEPYAPYDTLWADPARKPVYQEQVQLLRRLIPDPMRNFFVMPTRQELEQARIDVPSFLENELDWYDGSIRAMDAEIGRVMETLQELGLDQNTLVAVVSDHGEEFLEHGSHYHGQSVYGELARVPLLLRWPAGLPAGRRIAETVQTIDLMPTLLELSGIETENILQGQSLVPLMTSSPGETRKWQRRPAITEKPQTAEGATFMVAARDTASIGLVYDGWKLVHNTRWSETIPRYELYDHRQDPLDLVDVAADHPDVVARLAALLDRWQEHAESYQLASDDELARDLQPEELERLRSLGYIQ